ncbi:MAG TPA: hypothetical protein VEP90_28400 [Methylomirabilota bacterium]|nr:hypothetical protein [Methylomirabilota bacterium]
MKNSGHKFDVTCKALLRTVTFEDVASMEAESAGVALRCEPRHSASLARLTKYLRISSDIHSQRLMKRDFQRCTPENLALENHTFGRRLSNEEETNTVNFDDWRSLTYLRDLPSANREQL